MNVARVGRILVRRGAALVIAGSMALGPGATAAAPPAWPQAPRPRPPSSTRSSSTPSPRATPPTSRRTSRPTRRRGPSASTTTMASPGPSRERAAGPRPVHPRRHHRQLHHPGQPGGRHLPRRRGLRGRRYVRGVRIGPHAGVHRRPQAVSHPGHADRSPRRDRGDGPAGRRRDRDRHGGGRRPSIPEPTPDRGLRRDPRRRRGEGHPAGGEPVTGYCRPVPRRPHDPGRIHLDERGVRGLVGRGGHHDRLDLVEATGYAPSPATFYPYPDKYVDTTAIRGVRYEPASVSVKIYSAATGKLVRTLAVGTGSGSWRVA